MKFDENGSMKNNTKCVCKKMNKSCDNLKNFAKIYGDSLILIIRMRRDKKENFVFYHKCYLRGYLIILDWFRE